MHPQVAATDPNTPAILLPTNVAALIENKITKQQKIMKKGSEEK